VTEKKSRTCRSQDSYALVASAAKPVDAPVLSYERRCRATSPSPSCLIGAGGISFAHLDAYKKYGLNVVRDLRRHLDRAESRRNAYFPNAVATDKLDDVIGAHIPVLDLTVHAKDRVALMRRALEAASTCCRRSRSLRDSSSAANWSRSPTARPAAGGQPERPLGAASLLDREAVSRDLIGLDRSHGALLSVVMGVSILFCVLW